MILISMHMIQILLEKTIVNRCFNAMLLCLTKEWEMVEVLVICLKSFITRTDMKCIWWSWFMMPHSKLSSTSFAWTLSSVLLSMLLQVWEMRKVSTITTWRIDAISATLRNSCLTNIVKEVFISTLITIIVCGCMSTTLSTWIQKIVQTLTVLNHLCIANLKQMIICGFRDWEQFVWTC